VDQQIHQFHYNQICRDNQIVQVHRDLSRLVLLSELHMQGNQLRLLPPEMAEMEELAGSNGALFLDANPWILPIQDQVKLGPTHVMTYLASSTYAIIYARNK
jgi:hypothetical protein